ncbi:uncharacterized protein [Engystomops pustulosus]|uniref:uncharacterized protein n=1 Tax=Engystomops pustulosus TaxID=76066 RepID=UPI003AFAEDB1
MPGDSPGRGHPGWGDSPGKAQASRPTPGGKSQTISSRDANPTVTSKRESQENVVIVMKKEQEEKVSEAAMMEVSPRPGQHGAAHVVSAGRAAGAQPLTPAPRQRRTSLERQTLQENLQQKDVVSSMAATGRTRSTAKPLSVPAQCEQASSSATAGRKTGAAKETGAPNPPGAAPRPAQQGKETVRAPELRLAEEIPGLDQLQRVDFYDNISDWWENVKEEIRSLLKRLSVKKGKSKYSQYLKLRKELESLYSAGGDDKQKIDRLKSEIKQYQYSLYTSLVVELDYGTLGVLDPYENCRERVAKKSITGLTDSQGVLQESREGILGVVRSYYAELFQKKVLDKEKMAQFLEATPGPDTRDLDFSPLTAGITEEEVKEAFDKAPGPCGCVY